MAKKHKEKFVDDGRVIADMNVDGMPWVNSAQAVTKPVGANDAAPHSSENGEENHPGVPLLVSNHK